MYQKTDGAINAGVIMDIRICIGSIPRPKASMIKIVTNVETIIEIKVINAMVPQRPISMINFRILIKTTLE